MSSLPRSRVAAPFTFFVDRSIGKKAVPAALRAELRQGERLLVHDEHFPQNEPDTTWLTAVGTEGWIAITQDARIRYRPNEIGALLAARSAIFIITAAQAKGEFTAKIAVAALPEIRYTAERYDVAIVAGISKSASVSLYYVAGARLEKPKPVKAQRGVRT